MALLVGSIEASENPATDRRTLRGFIVTQEFEGASRCTNGRGARDATAGGSQRQGSTLIAAMPQQALHVP